MAYQDSTVILDDSVSRVAVRIPLFWPEESELWFAQLERQLAICGITEDEAKYAQVLSKIEPKQAREIKDIITHPSATKNYKAIKRAIQRLTDSQGQHIRQLLEHKELGERKLSHFIRHINILVGMMVPNKLKRTL